MTTAHRIGRLARRTARTQLFPRLYPESHSFFNTAIARLRIPMIMDPLSIATSVVSLCGLCLVTVKKVGEVTSKFKEASQILLAVSSQAKLINTSLSQLYSIIVSDENAILAQALLTTDIRNALDISLTGCVLTLSCIDSEIHSLTSRVDSDQQLKFADRIKVVWKDDRFKEPLRRLCDHHDFIEFLQKMFQR
jgi:hypothetical protein